MVANYVAKVPLMQTEQIALEHSGTNLFGASARWQAG